MEVYEWEHNWINLTPKKNSLFIPIPLFRICSCHKILQFRTLATETKGFVNNDKKYLKMASDWKTANKIEENIILSNADSFDFNNFYYYPSNFSKDFINRMSDKLNPYNELVEF